MSILENIDFQKYKFGLIAIENNEEDKGNGQRLKEFMLRNGYRCLVELEWDMLFIPMM